MAVSSSLAEWAASAQSSSSVTTNPTTPQSSISAKDYVDEGDTVASTFTPFSSTNQSRRRNKKTKPPPLPDVNYRLNVNKRIPNVVQLSSPKPTRSESYSMVNNNSIFPQSSTPSNKSSVSLGREMIRRIEWPLPNASLRVKSRYHWIMLWRG